MNKKLNEIYLKKMEECTNYEPEYGHGVADEILCELLIKYGYTELVEKFNKLEKWYS